MKYELFKEKPSDNLYRIRALKSFIAVNVGDIGGYVESEKNLSQDGTCWIFGLAEVTGNARVYEGAVINGHALVCDNAKVHGNAFISNNAVISNNAEIYGKGSVIDDASVSGNGKVFDNAMVYGSASISGDAMIYEGAHIKEKAQVIDKAQVYGNAIVKGGRKCVISGNTRVYGDAEVWNTEVSGFAEIYDKAKVKNSVITDYAKIHGSAKVQGMKIDGNKEIITGNPKITESHKDLLIDEIQELLADQRLKYRSTLYYSNTKPGRYRIIFKNDVALDKMEKVKKLLEDKGLKTKWETFVTLFVES